MTTTARQATPCTLLTKGYQISLARGLSIGIGLVLSLAVVPASAWAKRQEPSRGPEAVIFSYAKELFEAGRDEEARHEFQKVLLLNPYHVGAREYLKRLAARHPLPPIIEPPTRAAAAPHATDDARRHAIDRALDDVQARAERAAQEEAMQRALEQAGRRVAPPAESRQPPTRLTETPETERTTPPSPTWTPGAPARAQAAAPTTAPEPQPASTGAESPVRLFVDGREVTLATPGFFEDGQPYLPLRDVARALGYGVVDLGPGQVQLIAPTGETRTVTVSVTQPVLAMTPEELEDAFRVELRYDEARQVVSLQTGAPTDLTTYTVPKSEEQLQAEETQRVIAEQVAAPPVPETIPPEARPTVELSSVVTYSYDDPHRGPPLRSLTVRTFGHVGEFDLSSETQRRDRNGIFDHDFTYANFRSDDLFIGLVDQRTDLLPLRTQFQDFEGVKLQRIWGDPKTARSARAASRYGVRALEPIAERLPITTLNLGTIENTTSGSEGLVRYLGEFYEVRQQVVASDWLAVEGGLMYLANDADLPELSGTSSYPRTSLVPFGFVEVPLPLDLTLSGQVARSAYEPDSAPDDEHIADWNWRTALGWDTERARLQTAFEFVGKDYASVGDPLTYQDYRGVNLYGTYRLTDRWNVSGTFLRYRDNVNEDPEDTLTRNQAVSVSSNVRVNTDQSINVNVSDTIGDPDGPLAGSSIRTNTYRVDYFRPFLGKVNLLSSYQFLHSDSRTTGDRSAHTIGAAFFGSFGRGSSWYLSQQVEKAEVEDAPNTLNLNTTLNLNHQIGQALSTYLNATYTRDVSTRSAGSDVLSGAVGLRYEIAPDDLLVGAEYEVSSYDLDHERGHFPRDWSVLFLVRKFFGFSSPPNFGHLEGIVFQDLNNNGRQDPDEAGLEDVLIVVDRERRATSDAEGTFGVPRLVPGQHPLEVDLSNVDPVWMVVEPPRDVLVRRQRVARIVLPAIQGASLEGRVFIDANEDGIFQDTDEPLEDVAVVLLPGDEFRRTDAEGVFAFEHLVPGPYSVQLYLEDLPQGYGPVSPEMVDVPLQAGEVRTDVNFAVRLLEEIQRFE